MNCRELLSVVVLLFCTNIRAAPPIKSTLLTPSNDESNRSTLLNQGEHELPLKVCSDPAKDDVVPCQLYSDIFAKFNETVYAGNMAKKIKFNGPVNASVLCTDILSRLDSGYKLFEGSKSKNPAIMCTLICFNRVTGLPHEACVAAWWMLNEMLIKATAIPEHVITAEAFPGLPEQQKQAPIQVQVPIVTKPDAAKIPAKALTTPEVVEKPPAILEVVVQPKEPSPSPTTVKVESAPAPIVVSTPLNQADAPVPKVPQSVANSEQTIENQPSDHESQDVIPVDDGENLGFDGDDDGNKDILEPISVQKPPQDYEKQESIVPVSDPFFAETGSNFFSYFLFGMFACIILYVVYNNKSKILALVLEGRRSQAGRNGRKKHTAAYRKLDTNLEEAITSSATSGRASQIIY